MSNQKIGIFGGTFNPVHNGHLHICRAFLDSSLIDELWIIPVFDPPHKPSEQLISFDHRFEMTKLAFSRIANVKVLEIERELPRPNYTLKTVEYLMSTYSDKTYLLCLGGDSLKHFDTWYMYEELLKKVQLIVVKREPISFDGVKNSILQRSIFIQSKLTPESSSDIRKDIENTGTTNQLPEDVLNYIRTNDLFITTSH